MIKRIYLELVEIRKELQAIQGSLEFLRKDYSYVAKSEVTEENFGVNKSKTQNRLRKFRDDDEEIEISYQI